MAKILWDGTGERLYEAGVQNGVLYLPDVGGAYSSGVAWNGLVTVTESPSGAESNPQYADNQKYLNLISAEEFACTVEALTYPTEFNKFDGNAAPQAGVTIGQQSRGVFGLSYVTKIGNDVEGDDLGLKLHLVYGCQAAPSEKAYGTINDSPEAITFSWEVTTTPVAVTGYKPTALITIDSTLVSSAAWTAIVNACHGTGVADPYLPTPDAVLGLLGSPTTVSPDDPTNVGNDITIPTDTGVDYFVNGVEVLPANNPLTITENTEVVARPEVGYAFADGDQTRWFFTYS